MSTSRQLSAKRGKLGAYLLAAAAISTLAGCSGTGSTFDANKGFLDPTAVGRYQQQPLVVPILSSLDRSVDVGDQQFRYAMDVQPADLDQSNNDYAIGRNDLLNIAITDLVAPNVETVRSNRVSESGMISLPLIGQVKAAGLTEAELEKAIGKAYRDANLIQNAQVSVSVLEARARTFSILGSVAAPGQYAILNSEFRVMDALVLAKDVNSQGIDYIYVVRQVRDEKSQGASEAKPAPAKPAEDVLTPKSDAAKAVSAIRAQASPAADAAVVTDDNQKIITVDGKQVKVTPEGQAATVPGMPANAAEAAPAVPSMAAVAASQPFEFKDPVVEGKTKVIRVPYEKLRNGDLRYNIIIKPYDLVVVPQPTVGEYYMGGHVSRVGVYSLTARKITLKQAIVSAGMFDQIGIPARTDVVRRVGDDKEIFVSVDLDKVFAGMQPDVFLKPNDVVTVGTTWWAPFAAAVRGGFRMTYGFGFLYDRNFASYDDPFGMAGRSTGSSTTN